MSFNVLSVLNQPNNTAPIETITEPVLDAHPVLTSILSSESTQQHTPSPALPANASIDTEAAISPFDHLIAIINQLNSSSIPVNQEPPTDENLQPMGHMNLDFSALLALLMVNQNSIQSEQQRGQKRKHESIVPFIPDSSSFGNDISQALVRSFAAPELLPQFSPFVQGGQKRKSPLNHANSICSNCGTRVTSNWRRSIEGEAECNSCNLYFKKHGIKRPANMHNRMIHKRVKKEQRNDKIVQSVVNEMIKVIEKQERP